MVGSLVTAAALLVAVAGLAKTRAPGPAARMLVRAWPSLRRIGRLPLAVRAAGAGEAALAAAVLVDGGRLATALLAACYLVFAAVALRMTVSGQRTSCGCFGRMDSPVGGAHVALNVAGVGVTTAGAVDPAGPVGGLFDDGALTGLVGSAQSVLLAWLGVLAITALPELAALRRRVTEGR